ncbi:hypothetical protein RB195_014290 [Necator americanus]|uniref:Uncharacterized protein n=1 Tax=Necator americanus TaxID=51031 RepID=A0ABR1DZY1_NECAM
MTARDLGLTYLDSREIAIKCGVIMQTHYVTFTMNGTFVLAARHPRIQERLAICKHHHLFFSHNHSVLFLPTLVHPDFQNLHWIDHNMIGLHSEVA